VFWTSARICTYLEMSVIVLQVFGVLCLCLSRLLPATLWARVGPVGYVVALVGLGLTGALCGCHQSKFALYAGASMTILLIGMIAGNGSIDVTASTRSRGTPEPNLA
jgi:hypothetical protein